MWPDQVSNPGPLTYESGALLTALRGLASQLVSQPNHLFFIMSALVFKSTFHKL